MAATALAGLALDGTRGAMSAAAMSGVAIAMQWLAARVMWRTGIAPTVDHLSVYGAGVVLRMLGVAVMGGLLLRFPLVFSPWPSVAGYLGTVLPLLYLETRLGR